MHIVDAGLNSIVLILLGPWRRRESGMNIMLVLSTQVCFQRLNFRITRVFSKIGFGVAACVRKKFFVNEIDRGSGAFNVEKNDAYL